MHFLELLISLRPWKIIYLLRKTVQLSVLSRANPLAIPDTQADSGSRVLRHAIAYRWCSTPGAACCSGNSVNQSMCHQLLKHPARVYIREGRSFSDRKIIMKTFSQLHADWLPAISHVFISIPPVIFNPSGTLVLDNYVVDRNSLLLQNVHDMHVYVTAVNTLYNVLRTLHDWMTSWRNNYQEQHRFNQQSGQMVAAKLRASWPPSQLTALCICDTPCVIHSSQRRGSFWSCLSWYSDRKNCVEWQR